MSRFLSDIQKGSFLFTSDHPEQYYEQLTESLNESYKELEKDNIDAGYIIKETFFSPRNVDIIQKWLIKEVKQRTNIIISYQKMEHIMNIMAPIYETYAQHLPFNLKEQIYELDTKVVETIVPHIIIELQSRVNYLETIENANYISNPLFMGARGQRALPSTMSF